MRFHVDVAHAHARGPVKNRLHQLRNGRFIRRRRLITPVRLAIPQTRRRLFQQSRHLIGRQRRIDAQAVGTTFVSRRGTGRLSLRRPDAPAGRLRGTRGRSLILTLIQRLKALLNLGFQRNHRNRAQPRAKTKFVQHVDVGRIRNGDGQPLTDHAHGHDPVLRRPSLRHQRRQVRINDGRQRTEGGQPILLAQKLQQRVFGHGPLRNEDVAQRLCGLPMSRQRGIQLCRSNAPGIKK